MISAKYEWHELALNQTAASEILTKELGVAPLVAEILCARGYDTIDKARAFLEPSITSFHDPYALFDMQKAVDRIQTAIVNGEKITIYGDYDADGLTSTAIMYETLTQLGANVVYYIPDRFKDGYGPNKDVYERLITEEQTELIVTVDNGVSGFEALEFAKQKGIDVIVTDHHELPPKLPEAYAIIHPRHPAGNYPFGELSGAGVAFKVATALLDEIPQDLLDLATIGTVSDLVSLTGENRALVKFGLSALENTLRPGLLALYELAGIEQQSITADTIGFLIGPRLNAIGRMQHAQSGVELLTTLDDELAEKLAKEAQQLNVERQKLVEEITAQAESQIAKQPETLVNVVAGEGWHEGVLGIVASRLVEKTGRPMLVLNIGANNIAKGSGRSVADFHLFKALDGHRDLLTSFGGHHMACGLSLKADNLDQLRAVLVEEANNQGLDVTKKAPLAIVGQLSATKIDLQLYESLEKLAPFGVDNELPLFEITDFHALGGKAIGKQQEHLRLELQADLSEQKLTALDFGLGSEIPAVLNSLAMLKFVAALDKNEWRGQTSVQLMIKDLTTATTNNVPQIQLGRAKKLTTEMFENESTYGFFNLQLAQKIKAHLPAKAQVVIFDGHLEPLQGEELILVDLPQNLAQLEFVLQRVDFKKITAIFYTKKTDFTVPARATFAQVYKTIFKLGKLELPKDLNQVAQGLQMSVAELTLVLKVFFEAGFVTIDNGVLTGVAGAKAHRLEDTKSYQVSDQQKKMADALLYSTDDSLQQWLLGHFS